MCVSVSVSVSVCVSGFCDLYCIKGECVCVA